jgi:hypothetical protein
MAVTQTNTVAKAMKTRLFFVPVLLFAPICILFVPDMGSRFFLGLFVFISYVGIAMALLVFSIDNEVECAVRRQRQIHRVQAIVQQIEELERLAERLTFK